MGDYAIYEGTMIDIISAVKNKYCTNDNIKFSDIPSLIDNMPYRYFPNECSIINNFGYNYLFEKKTSNYADTVTDVIQLPYSQKTTIDAAGGKIMSINGCPYKCYGAAIKRGVADKDPYTLYLTTEQDVPIYFDRYTSDNSLFLGRIQGATEQERNNFFNTINFSFFRGTHSLNGEEFHASYPTKILKGNYPNFFEDNFPSLSYLNLTNGYADYNTGLYAPTFLYLNQEKLLNIPFYTSPYIGMINQIASLKENEIILSSPYYKFTGGLFDMIPPIRNVHSEQFYFGQKYRQGSYSTTHMPYINNVLTLPPFIVSNLLYYYHAHNEITEIQGMDNTYVQLGGFSETFTNMTNLVNININNFVILSPLYYKLPSYYEGLSGIAYNNDIKLTHCPNYVGDHNLPIFVDTGITLIHGFHFAMCQSLEKLPSVLSDVIAKSGITPIEGYFNGCNSIKEYPSFKNLISLNGGVNIIPQGDSRNNYNGFRPIKGIYCENVYGSFHVYAHCNMGGKQMITPPLNVNGIVYTEYGIEYEMVTNNSIFGEDLRDSSDPNAFQNFNLKIVVDQKVETTSTAQDEFRFRINNYYYLQGDIYLMKTKVNYDHENRWYTTPDLSIINRLDYSNKLNLHILRNSRFYPSSNGYSGLLRYDKVYDRYYTDRSQISSQGMANPNLTYTKTLLPNNIECFANDMYNIYIYTYDSIPFNYTSMEEYSDIWNRYME